MLLATVTATSPDPLRVRVDGATSDSSAGLLSRADAYAPAVNARVLVVRRGSRLIVLGEVT